MWFASGSAATWHGSIFIMCTVWTLSKTFSQWQCYKHYLKWACYYYCCCFCYYGTNYNGCIWYRLSVLSMARMHAWKKSVNELISCCRNKQQKKKVTVGDQYFLSYWLCLVWKYTIETADFLAKYPTLTAFTLQSFSGKSRLARLHQPCRLQWPLPPVLSRLQDIHCPMYT